MNAWANFIGYQITWFIVVDSAARNHASIGLAAAAAFVGGQLVLSAWCAVDLRLIAGALILGATIDGALSALGWVRYADAAFALPPGGAPVWILSLWAAFALTLSRSLAWLQRRPWLAALLGAGGGPLAYWSAERGFNAVEFVPPQERAVIGLALGWVVAIPTLLYLLRRWTPVSRIPAAGGAPSEAGSR